MTDRSAVHITSRDNALLKELHRLAQDNTAYRKQKRVWLEGDHLCRAAMTRGVRPAIAIFSESFWPLTPTEWTQAAIRNVVMADS
ncbi:MAG: RNA methyltransferase, partial [Rhodoferax sp.]